MAAPKGLAMLATACLVASAVIVAPQPASAAPPAPVILNAGGQNGPDAQWVETQAQPDDGGASVKQFVATFLVQHAPGRSITALRLDADFDGTDDTATSSLFGVTAQTYGFGGSIETSRVTVSLPLSKPAGFACSPTGGGVRSVDAPVRVRVIDSTGEQSTTVATTVRFVEDVNCVGFQDFPRLTSTTQTAIEVTPGQSVTYTFACSDPDTDFLSSDDDCDRANIRWRRLNDGATSQVVLKTGMADDTNQTHVLSFPARGYYVVEAQLGNEDGTFPNTAGSTAGWWRLGSAVVNDTGSLSLSGSLSFQGVNASTPPSVNIGGTVTAVATGDDTGGSIQIIEWDATNDGAFERREYAVPGLVAGDVVHPDLSATELSQGISTATSGLVTVRARITDNGALDAADNIRRQLTLSGQLRINARPTATDVTTATNEDSPLTVTLAGGDTDAQPETLTYEIVSGPSAGTGSLGAVTGNQVEFTPAPGFSGSTSFTYRARDGGPATVAAWAYSETATVHITVNDVNDPPVVDPASTTTQEDSSVVIPATASDDASATLAWSVASQPTNGRASCEDGSGTTGSCTYSPAEDFFGEDTFVVRATDGGGASGTATFTVTVNAVNDAPVPDSQLVVVAEDADGFPINLTASDVDDTSLTFTAPLEGPAHGSVSCDGPACAYTPAANYTGPDAFSFSVSDGSLNDVALVSIDVTAVNDDPVASDVLDAVTDEDTSATLTLGGTDVDGDAVTVSGAADPANGSASVVGPNSVDYDPDPDFSGTDSFAFTVTDGQGGTDTGSVMITVNAVNDAPVVADQSFGATEDTSAAFSVVAGDVDGDTLTWSIVTRPSHGDLTGAGPDVDYAPDPDFNGTDSFVVRVSDGNGGADTATISITVAGVNDAPTATDQAATVSSKSSVTISLSATDIDGDALTFTAPITGPAHGELVCTGASCRYSPARNYHGPDGFTFRVDDGNGGTDTGTISITVTPGKKPPGRP